MANITAAALAGEFAPTPERNGRIIKELAIVSGASTDTGTTVVYTSPLIKRILGADFPYSAISGNQITFIAVGGLGAGNNVLVEIFGTID